MKRKSRLAQLAQERRYIPVLALTGHQPILEGPFFESHWFVTVHLMIETWQPQGLPLHCRSFYVRLELGNGTITGASTCFLRSARIMSTTRVMPVMSKTTKIKSSQTTRSGW